MRIDELKSNLQRLLDNPVEVAWRRSREYKEMKERLWEVNHPDEALPEGSSDEEGDLVVATAKQSLICPITQSDFVDPVTNPSCGHSYSRAGITALAERRAGSVQCPIHGCRHAVVIANLTRNTRLERRVARKKQPKIY